MPVGLRPDRASERQPRRRRGRVRSDVAHPPVVRVVRPLAGRRFAPWREPEPGVSPPGRRVALAMATGLAAEIAVWVSIGRPTGLPFLLTSALVHRVLGRRRDRVLADALGRVGHEIAAVVWYAVADDDVRASVGRDEGMLALADGWLVFRGLRTEWSLSPADAVLRDALLQIDLSDGLYSLVTFAAPGGEYGLRPFGELRSLLDRWADCPRPPGEPVFPPVLPASRLGYGGWSGGTIGQEAMSSIFRSVAIALVLVGATMSVGVRGLLVCLGGAALPFLLVGLGIAAKRIRRRRRLLRRVAAALEAQPS